MHARAPLPSLPGAPDTLSMLAVLAALAPRDAPCAAGAPRCVQAEHPRQVGAVRAERLAAAAGCKLQQCSVSQEWCGGRTRRKSRQQRQARPMHTCAEGPSGSAQ